MAQPLIVAMPPGIEMKGGYTVALTAVDPTTGAEVAGVDVSNVAFQVDLFDPAGPHRLPTVLLLRQGTA